MMPNITRGGRMSGLLVYLAGPGRANEHTNPHVVAGDIGITAFDDGSELDRDEALAIARFLDGPHRQFGTSVKRAVRIWDEAQGKMVTSEFRDADVWHCSLSLRASEGQLTDSQWTAIATDFVREMGFAGDGIGKSDCRWVAIHHGLSTAGNDHVHLAVSLVREDGTKASVHHDYRRAQQVVSDLEHKYGLDVLTSREHGRGRPGVSPGYEKAAQRRSKRYASVSEGQRFYESRHGKGETSWTDLDDGARHQWSQAAMRERLPREAMARRVRMCARAAQSEAEFVRGCRRSGLRIRPRFAQGTTAEVLGYSVTDGTVPRVEQVWFGGRRLGYDLSLRELRKSWTTSPRLGQEAVAEWRAAWAGSRIVGADIRVEIGADDWAEQAEDMRASLINVPRTDRAAWARAAGELSGMFAAWSNATESDPGPLAHASTVLARASHTNDVAEHPKLSVVPVGGTTATIALCAMASSQSKFVSQAALLTQMIRTMQAIHGAIAADGDTDLSRSIERSARYGLAPVRARVAGQSITDDIREVIDLASKARTPTTGLAPGRGPAPTHRARDIRRQPNREGRDGPDL